ncbi:hypothetical protein CPB85DRAFT_1446132 [Mucidula mucida]|nr:hypothetical protein CPB85DRAFT_1449295 [Mucidula mucida]KAF8870444.1 hypothetical protein CPB85DRAFT_1446132 [Mucidula mucida]
MAGTVINHLLHAAEGAMWSGPNVIVAHLDEYGNYASRKGFMVDVPKTKAMVFGVIPDVRSTLNFQGKSIEWVDEPKHLGTTFTSRKGGLFARMYATKANCQCGAALTESAAAKAVTVYKARIANHLQKLQLM